MNYLLSMLFPLIVSLVIVIIAMTHLQRWKGITSLSISSLIIFMLMFLMATAYGNHKCDQGSAPEYIAILSGAMGMIVPWIRKVSVWRRRCIVAAVSFVWISIGMFLTSSYHGEKITGNPKYSNGRFWHTALTGQYPRSVEPGGFQRMKIERMMKELKSMEAIEANPTEQGGTDEPAAGPQLEPSGNENSNPESNPRSQ